MPAYRIGEYQSRTHLLLGMGEYVGPERDSSDETAIRAQICVVRPTALLRGLIRDIAVPTEEELRRAPYVHLQ